MHRISDKPLVLGLPLRAIRQEMLLELLSSINVT
jgi:hypothetical protein